MESSPACSPHYECKGERELKIPSPRGGPNASRKRFPLSAPRTAPAGREHALLARGLPLLLIALAALVLSSVGHAQDVGPGTCVEYRADGGLRPGDGHWPGDLCAVVHHRRPYRRLLPVVGGGRPQSRQRGHRRGGAVVVPSEVHLSSALVFSPTRLTY